MSSTTKLKIFMKKPEKKEEGPKDELEEKPKPVIDRFPARDWNVGDFTGKCKILF